MLAKRMTPGWSLRMASMNAFEGRLFDVDDFDPGVGFDGFEDARQDQIGGQ